MTEQQVKNEFHKAVVRLSTVLEEAQKIWPDAELYCSVNCMNLMSGPHHKGKLQEPCYENVIASKAIKGLDCGDW